MFKRENNAGLYLTIAVHLGILIILLGAKIHSIVSEESAFVLDFTREEQIEQVKKEEQIRDQVKDEIDAMINGGPSVRNAVVDASSRRGQDLRDDRYKNPSQVYDEARRLQEKLNASKREAEAYQGSDENVSSESSKKSSSSDTYKGPSVISYKLEGRKSLNLPVPAYKCIGGGDVTVIITVNKKGYVTSASIDYSTSSTDPCIQEYAIRAAKSSRFTASSTAPDKQVGEILYRFIAQ